MQILDKIGILNTFIYSNLDPSARKINAAKFQNGKVKVLVVTDVAARGIDIPHLDNVINLHFPATSKLFVHRVGQYTALDYKNISHLYMAVTVYLLYFVYIFTGRCARAGKSGIAYNIVAPDEYPYLLDLHLFLGRSLNVVPVCDTEDIPEEAIGKIPQSMVEEELSELIMWHENSTDIVRLLFYYYQQ